MERLLTTNIYMHTAPGQIAPQISANFDILKFFSIIMVFAGHFLGGKLGQKFDFLWVPVTVGLMIFSFSSGYFTGIKYREDYDLKVFWQRKIERLGLNLLIINLALLCLFLIQGESGVFTWYTVINVFGLNGFLNWFHITNLSPFGKGMWFFTLLLIFYASYPCLEKMSKKQMAMFTIFFIVIAFFLNIYVKYGHSLWLTACGFVTGVFFGRHDIELPPVASRWFAILLFALMIMANFNFQVKVTNFFFIFFFSLFFIFSVVNLKAPAILLKISSVVSDCLLGVYLLHPYFKVQLSGMLLLDFFASLCIVFSVAKLLSSLDSYLLGLMKKVAV
jgi:hypothetical protein